METLSDARIAEIFQSYGLAPDFGVFAQIRTYVALLLKWNATISLTAITDPIEICKLHFGESIFAVSAVPVRDGRLADVGSGAGFPGLPLRMASPEIELTLIESNARKAAFLSEVVRALELEGVEIFRGRMKDHTPDKLYDRIAARALGQHDNLLKWATKNLNPSGRVVLWLGEDDSAAISQAPNWDWRFPIPIPGSKRRVLLVGSPRK
jgi:16S rRNA (guanine527-N7)-methyltransferase